MSAGVPYRVIDGIKCYHPDVAESYAGYPSSGFEITDEVEGQSFWVRSRLRLLRREVLRLAQKSRCCKFLEIGCGTGLLLQSLADETNMNLLGSEVYLRGLRSAQLQASRVEFIQLDATEIPFESEFDVIGAFDVIEHIDEDMRVLCGVRAALRPGGHLVITVPQHPFLWSRLDELVHHQRRYTRLELVSKIEAAGLKLTYVTSFIFALFPLMMLSRLLDREDPEASDADAFARRVRFHPAVNRILDAITRLDEFLIRLRLSLPWGGTLMAIAQRPHSDEAT